MNFFIFTAGLLLTFSFSAHAENVPFHKTHTLTSQEYIVQEKIPSMTGPEEIQEFKLGEEEASRVWLTGLDMKAVDLSEGVEIPNDYLCHANLVFGEAQSPADDTFHSGSHSSQRVENLHRFHSDGQIKKISLSMGYTNVQFPFPFGIPLYSARPLFFNSMMLNQEAKENPLSLNFETTLTYIQDKDALKPMRALADRRLKMSVPVRLDGSKKSRLPKSVSDNIVEYGEDGQKYSYHWYVPPGRHKYRQKVKEGLRIPFDTTIHHATTHLHPHARSMELYDLTAKKSVFKAKVKGHKNRPGIAVIAQYSSKKGVPVYQNHEYELITVYKNTTSQPIDAMAIMYIYFWDKEFQWAAESLPQS